MLIISPAKLSGLTAGTIQAYDKTGRQEQRFMGVWNRAPGQISRYQDGGDLTAGAMRVAQEETRY